MREGVEDTGAEDEVKAWNEVHLEYEEDEEDEEDMEAAAEGTAAAGTGVLTQLLPFWQTCS